MPEPTANVILHRPMQNCSIIFFQQNFKLENCRKYKLINLSLLFVQNWVTGVCTLYVA